MLLWLPPMWLLCRYDDVATVLKDHERFSNVYFGEIHWTPRWMKPLYQHMLVLDPPDHTRLRALVGKAFTPRLVEGLRGRIETLCDELLDAAAARGSFDLVSEFALPIPLTIIADLLSIPKGDRGQFAAWTRRLSASTSGTLADFILAMPAARRFLRYFRHLTDAHQTLQRDDLLSALVRAEEAGDRLSEDELLGMTMLLLIAGYETTVHLIVNSTLELMLNHEQRDYFVRNPDRAGVAIEELVRFTSPVDVLSPRVTRTDVAINGTTIPKDEVVVLILGSANRDPSRFENPDKLDLSRDPNKHLGFGSGIHYCIGAPLARLEGRIALTKLFARFPNLKLAVPKTSIRWRRGLAFRGPVRLPVITGSG